MIPRSRYFERHKDEIGVGGDLIDAHEMRIESMLPVAHMGMMVAMVRAVGEGRLPLAAGGVPAAGCGGQAAGAVVLDIMRQQ